MSVDFSGACERLLSATANGVYQGVLVALLAGFAVRLFARTNAATRHAVWFGVLLFVTALIPAHLLLSFRPHRENPAKTGSTSGITQIALPTPDLEKTAGWVAADSVPPALQPGESVGENIEREPSLPGSLPLDEWSGKDAVPDRRADTKATETRWPLFRQWILKALAWNAETIIRLPSSICVCLVSVWIVLASIRCGLIAGRLEEVRCVKRTSTAPSQSLQTLFDRLRGSLATRRNVQLRLSNAHRTAVVLGFVHPVVLLPAEMDKDAGDSDVEHVLRHELAHVGRWDDWGNLAQQFIQATLFFHPAIWWIGAKLSLEREIACDDRVLETSGRPRAYALTLANVASRMSRRRHLLAPGVSNNNSQLQQRITMILNTQRNRSPRLAGGRLGILATATAMLAVLAINAGPRVVLAQSPNTESAPAAEAVKPDPASESVPAVEVESAPEAQLRAPVAVSVAPLASISVAPAVKVSVEDSARATPTPAPLVLVAGVSPAPASANWSTAESGPRHKPAEDDSPSNIASTSSVPPAPPALPELATTSAPALEPVPPMAPAASRSMKRHLSIEERLDRIERILEDLEVRRDVKGASRDSVSGSWNKNANRLAAESGADFESKRAAEQAERAAEQVRRAVGASQRAADMAMRDVAKLKGKDFARMEEDMRAVESENSAKALEALREARGTLQAQIKTLEQQIKRLEEERNELKKPGLSSDSSGERPEAK